MKNIVIENENLVALSALLSDYEGKIDVMPIDPPYNTNVNHIGYKDSLYVETWGEFMRKRLKIAYKLLSKTGVMFIHIDECEFCNLMSLCTDVFGKDNVVSMIWKKTNVHFDVNRKKKLESGMRRTHEFIVVCYKNKLSTSLNLVKQPVWNGEYFTDYLMPLESIIDNMGTTSSAKDELESIFGKKNVFSTPKPVKLIKELIRSATNKQSLVLDYFAGSGTTGHSVMDLNNEDCGSRKFILITNNESNIYTDVTVPRLKLAISQNNYDEEIEYIGTDKEDLC